MTLTDDLYHSLMDFYARGLQPPEAFGLTPSEMRQLCEDEYLLPHNVPVGTRGTIWGHPFIVIAELKDSH